MVPLVELFGAGLLIAVQLITPAIVLFARGLEKVTTFIRDTVLAGFRFVVDALNKLPFVDIQVDLQATAGSFDAMAVQIETAGAMADTAAGQTDGLATATKTAGTAAGTATGQTAGLATATETAGIKAGTAAGQTTALGTATATAGMQAGTATTAADQLAEATRLEAEAADKAKIAADLWAQAARENEAAARPLTTQIGILSDEMDEAYTATDSLGVIIGRTVPQVSALTTEYILQNMAATPLSRTMGILSDEMDEAYTATDNLGVIIGASKGPAVELANAIDQMTMDIEDAQAAADLNQAAFNGLTPELQAAAIEMGIFRGEIVEVGKVVGEVAMGLGTAAGSIMSGSNSSTRQRASGGIQTTSVFYDENGNLIGRSAFSGDEGGPPSAGSGQQLFANSTGDLFYDSDFINRAGDDFQGLADNMDITTTAVENLETALTGNTLVDSLNAVNGVVERWDKTLDGVVRTLGEAERATQLGIGATQRQTMASIDLAQRGIQPAIEVIQRQTMALIDLGQRGATGLSPISDLEKLLAQMTMRILDTAAAAELQEMALAATVAGIAEVGRRIWAVWFKGGGNGGNGGKGNWRSDQSGSIIRYPSVVRATS